MFVLSKKLIQKNEWMKIELIALHFLLTGRDGRDDSSRCFPTVKTSVIPADVYESHNHDPGDLQRKTDANIQTGRSTKNSI